MNTKYVVCNYGGSKIEVVQAERETDHNVWVDGHMHKKISSWSTYFETWDAAYSNLHGKAVLEVQRLESKLSGAKSFLDKVEQLQVKGE